MTRIEELEQSIDETVEKFRLEINKFKAELKNIKELAKESKKECKWKPTVGEKYWFKNDIGKVSHSTYMCSVDECRANNIPIFPTEEECERYWRFMDTVKEKSYSFSEEEWEDDEIDKLVIYYDYTRKEFGVTCTWVCKYLGEIYFKDKESAQYIIDNFKEEFMEFIL